MTSDLVNASFETIGAFITLLSVRQLYKDKVVKGVSVWPWCFFTAWGMWNIFYYPNLGQSLSGIAAVGMTTVNAWWIALYWKYSRVKEKQYNGTNYV